MTRRTESLHLIPAWILLLVRRPSSNASEKNEPCVNSDWRDGGFSEPPPRGMYPQVSEQCEWPYRVWNQNSLTEVCVEVCGRKLDRSFSHIIEDANEWRRLVHTLYIKIAEFPRQSNDLHLIYSDFRSRNNHSRDRTHVNSRGWWAPSNPTIPPPDIWTALGKGRFSKSEYATSIWSKASALSNGFKGTYSIDLNMIVNRVTMNNDVLTSPQSVINVVELIA